MAGEKREPSAPYDASSVRVIPDPTTYYQALDAVRERPAMYLGNNHTEDFGALIAFITGLEIGGGRRDP